MYNRHVRDERADEESPSKEASLRHRERFDDMSRRANMTSEHPKLETFRFLPGRELLRFGRFPSYTEVRDHLVPLPRRYAPRTFVSHRWLSPAHPDPDGLHFASLREHLSEDVLYWIDYACLPQGDT